MNADDEPAMNGQFSQFNQEKDLFADALDLVGDERESFLTATCQGNPGLLQRVRRLLQAQPAAAAILPDRSSPWNDPTVIERPGTVIGRYKLLEPLGEGGFGVVFLAEQREPVRRQVALKVIKAGMDTKQVIARFEAERQALALMDHPNIAKVLDGGVTGQKSDVRSQRSEATLTADLCPLTSDSGRPYFVMELVRGIPITRFCEENQLTVKERLELFIPVCHAIQHAHQKGVIHRDIKPGNVLVTQGTDPIPKVIDFGVAKAIHQPLTEKTLITGAAQMLGTPAYMSPEQAELGNPDIDTRTDVYSLGILLYELLAGTTPFPEERLKKSSYAEIQRIIREEEPEKPSTRLARRRSTSSATTAANQSQIANHKSAIPSLPTDLDWIVLKAIDKDRNRRYATPLELAADLQRHLDNRPIGARPPSAMYRLRKLARRNRVLFGAGAFVVATLVIGLCLALLGFARASEERRKAEIAAANAQAAVGFLRDDLLALADPYVAAGTRFRPEREMTLIVAIEQAAQRIGNRFERQPLIEASIRLTIGKAFERLGEVASSRAQLVRALEIYRSEFGNDSRETLAARDALAWLSIRARDFKEAVAAHREVLGQRRKIHPPGAPEIFESMNGLATAYAADPSTFREAEVMFRQVIQEGNRFLNPDHPVALAALSGLSAIYHQKGPWDEALRLKRDLVNSMARSLGPDHPDAIRAAAEEVYDYRANLEDYRTAVRLYGPVLERARRVLGPEDPTTRLLIQEQFKYDMVRGVWGNAIRGCRELVSVHLRKGAQGQPDVLWAEDMLGGCLRFFGDFQEAERIHRASVKLRLRTGQTRTTAEQRSLRYLAWSLFHQGKVQEAERCWQQVIEQNIPVFGPTNVRTIYNARDLVRILAAQGKWRECAGLFDELGDASLQNLSSHQPLGPLPVPLGIVVAELAGNASLSSRLFRSVMEFGRQSTNSIVVEQIAAATLMLDPDRLETASRGEILELAAKAKVLSATDKSVHHDLIDSAAQYRQGAIAEALDSCRLLSKNPDNSIAARAGYFQAMALQRQGLSGQATEALAEANARLQTALRSGLLDHSGQKDVGYVDRWGDQASGLLLRTEAERLVLGRRQSEPVDAEFLTKARESWQAQQDLLNQAERHGRQQEWSQAREAVVAAMARGPINWDQEGNFVTELPLKAASVFALTRDRKRYAELCHTLLNDAHESQIYYARCALLLPDALPADLLKKALTILRRQAKQLPASGRHQPWHDWAWLDLGICEYISGNHEAAAPVLARARDAFSLICAGEANAHSALLANHIGTRAEADVFLKKADELYQRILAGNTDGLGQDWHGIARFELSLKRAKDVLDGRAILPPINAKEPPTPPVQ